MAKRKKTAQIRKAAIGDLLGNVSEIESLYDEMNEWAENMESSSMEHLPKYDEVTEAREALESAKDKIESGKDDLEGIKDLSIEALLKSEHEFKYFPPAGYVSRQTRMEDARHEIEEAANALRLALENPELKLDDDIRKEVEDGLEQIEDGVSELDAVSFPGMY